MRDYYQPDFFKFGHDSLELANLIANLIGPADENILEVGTGCGVISIELVLKVENIRIDALEPQSDFYPYFRKNLELFNTSSIKLIESSLENFRPTKIYDMIFLNPPYFWESESRSSPDSRRDLCRRMKKKDFLNWLKIIKKILAPQGKVIMSYRSEDILKMIETSKDWRLEMNEVKSGCSILYFRNSC